MGKLELNKKQKKAALYTAAYELFVSKGFAKTTISDIVDRYVVDWVLNGVTDESWESYQSELEGAGLADLLSVWQGAVDRYNAE